MRLGEEKASRAERVLVVYIQLAAISKREQRQNFLKMSLDG